MVQQWSPSTAVWRVCLDVVLEAVSLFYWLRSWSEPVLLPKGTGCSCLSHSQTFPFLLLPWLFTLVVNRACCSDQIYHGKNKPALVSVGMAQLLQAPTSSTAAASWPQVEKFVPLDSGGVMLDQSHLLVTALSLPAVLCQG